MWKFPGRIFSESTSRSPPKKLHLWTRQLGTVQTRAKLTTRGGALALYTQKNNNSENGCERWGIMRRLLERLRYDYSWVVGNATCKTLKLKRLWVYRFHKNNMIKGLSLFISWFRTPVTVPRRSFVQKEEGKSIRMARWHKKVILGYNI